MHQRTDTQYSEVYAYELVNKPGRLDKLEANPFDEGVSGIFSKRVAFFTLPEKKVIYGLF
jgi:hypothetical protein